MKYFKLIRNVAVSIFILALAAASAPAIPALAAGESITLNMTQGAIGQTVTVTGSGFTRGGTITGVNIIFGEFPVTVGGAASTVNYTASFYEKVNIFELTGISGSFQGTFVVPANLTGGSVQKSVTTGTYYVYATYYSTPSNSGINILDIKTFTVIASAATGINVNLSASTGSIGQTVSIGGSGFYASGTTANVRGVNVIFGEYPVPVSGSSTTVQTVDYASSVWERMSVVQLASDGTFQASFTVPSRLTGGTTTRGVSRGSYYIYLTYYYPPPSGTTDTTTDPKGNEVLVIKPFTVIAGSITASPVDGNVGTVISISGSFFGNSENVILSYDGAVSSVNGTLVTNTAGAFGPVKFTVPASAAGPHIILVSGNDSGTNASTNFTVKPSIRIFPVTGSPGTLITILGTGFGASQSFSTTFGGDAITPGQTDAYGSFSLPFSLKAKPAGNYDIVVKDTGGNSAAASFNLTMSSISLSADTGKAGAQVDISGSGFLPQRPVTVTINGQKVGSGNTDAGGAFKTTFTVPSIATGSYKVIATDGSNPIEAAFSITANAVISPVTSLLAPGHVGTAVVITGQGFIPGGSLIVKYDGKQVTTATVKPDQSFSVTFNIPVSAAGEHAINVSDGTNTADFPFVMESSPPAAPAPLKPEMNAKTSTKPAFTWGQVNDISGVTYTLEISTDQNFLPSNIVLSKPGITTPQYTLADTERLKSAGKEAPYYWHVKATDGAGNQSQWSGTASFYVSSFLSLSQPVIYILIGVIVIVLIGLAFWFGRKTAYY